MVRTIINYCEEPMLVVVEDSCMNIPRMGVENAKVDIIHLEEP